MSRIIVVTDPVFSVNVLQFCNMDSRGSRRGDEKEGKSWLISPLALERERLTGSLTM